MLLVYGTYTFEGKFDSGFKSLFIIINMSVGRIKTLVSIPLLLKGGIPATPSGTATLLRLSPSYWFYPNEVFNLPLQVYPTSMA